MSTFKDYLQEKKASELVVGTDSIESKISRFFRGNWVEPLFSQTKAGVKYLKKEGFSDEEIVNIRAATKQAQKEFFGLEDNSQLQYDENFGGYFPNLMMSGTKYEKKARAFIEKRIAELLGE